MDARGKLLAAVVDHLVCAELAYQCRLLIAADRTNDQAGA